MAKVGTIYFAYVDDLEVFNDTLHNVEDESVFGISISQVEGEFARIEVEIINPREGLLKVGRQQRVFISAETGSGIQLLFSGRLNAFPLDIGEETITLELIAQPVDWFITQSAFLEALKVPPFYSDLYVPEDRRSDQDEILSGRAALLHWHRATEDLILSDIIEGGTIIDLAGNFFHDSYDSDLGDPPVTSIDIDVEVQWTQIGLGDVSLHEEIRKQFTNTAIGSARINTLTPLALENGWNGVNVPTGYTVKENSISPTADDFGLNQVDLESASVVVAGVDFPTKTGAEPASRTLSFPRVWYNPRLILTAEYQQKRREIMKTSVSVDTQDISLTTDKTEIISLRLQDPTGLAQGEPLDVGEPSFFTSAGVLSTVGIEAIEHVLLRAAARFKKASRNIEIQVECELDLILGITCDHSVRLEDDRLPGGSVIGKVIAYELIIEGDGGPQFGRVRIGCTIGTGVDSSGSGTAIGTRVYNNEHGPAIMTSEFFYEMPVPPTIDEPIDVSEMESDPEHLIVSATVTNDGETQNDAIVSEQFPDQFLGSNRTRIEVELQSLKPEPELFSQTNIVVSNLTLPKQIDLEA